MFAGDFQKGTPTNVNEQRLIRGISATQVIRDSRCVALFDDDGYCRLVYLKSWFMQRQSIIPTKSLCEAVRSKCWI